MKKRISPSFVGTTIATVAAVIYTYMYKVDFHLWTDLVKGLLLGGPIVVLITYTLTSFILEQYFDIKDEDSTLGSLDYPIRIVSQVFLGIALAAVGEDVRYYVISFMIFVVINTLLSCAIRKLLGRLFYTDIYNLLICGAYTVLSLELFELAANFEATYAAFAVDKMSYDVRVTQLRGEQANLLILLAVSVGAMVANILHHWSGWRRMQAQQK